MEGAKAGNKEASGFYFKGSGSHWRVLPVLICSSGCYVGKDCEGNGRIKGLVRRLPQPSRWEAG